MIRPQHEPQMNRDTVIPEEMRILLVEDDAPIAEVVGRGLRAAGYVVDVAEDGNRGLEMARAGGYGLVVLDLMLPGTSGYEVCDELRGGGVSVPILMLTARDGVRDRVRGLDSGADDYLVKPFEFEELMARVRALLRRDKVNRRKVIKVAYLTVDTEARRAWVDGTPVDLKAREYELLEALAANEGRVLTRDAIQDRVWGNEESYSNVVDVQVRRLRTKIEPPHLPPLIHTVRGVGYSLRRPEEPR
jgi:DNA-binding response OmpR family regulator